MNKKLMRIISAVMAICLLACMIVPAASAMPQESADGSIKHLHCCSWMPITPARLWNDKRVREVQERFRPASPRKRGA